MTDIHELPETLDTSRRRKKRSSRYAKQKSLKKDVAHVLSTEKKKEHVNTLPHGVSLCEIVNIEGDTISVQTNKGVQHIDMSVGTAELYTQKDRLGKIASVMRVGYRIPMHIARSGKVRFAKDFIEMVETCVDLGKLDPNERTYKIGSDWYHGFVCGFDAEQRPLICHGGRRELCPIDQSLLKTGMTLRYGQMVDICLHTNKKTKKKTIHLAETALSDRGRDNKQGVLLTKNSLVADELYTRNKERAKNHVHTDRLATKNKELAATLAEYAYPNTEGTNKRGRISALEWNYLSVTPEEQLIPGAKVYSRNGVPGIIVKNDPEDKVPDGQVKVKYFWKDTKGNKRWIVAATKHENLKRFV